MCENDNKGVCCSRWLLQGRHSTSDPTLTITIYVDPSFTSTHTHARTHSTTWRLILLENSHTCEKHAPNIWPVRLRVSAGMTSPAARLVTRGWPTSDFYTPCFAAVPPMRAAPCACFCPACISCFHLSSSPLSFHFRGCDRRYPSGSCVFSLVFNFIFVFFCLGLIFFVYMFKKKKSELCNGQHK